MKYESFSLALAAALATPFVVSAATLGSIDYNTSFVADSSFAAFQNLGNGTFTNGEKITGFDIRVGAKGGVLIGTELRAFLFDSNGAPAPVQLTDTRQTTVEGDHIYHFDLDVPFLPNPAHCYTFVFYQNAVPNTATTTFYGWSTDNYQAASSGCHSTYASDDINTLIQNPALNGHGLIDYSFQIYTEPIQSPPVISSLKQYRQFGVDEVAEGATFVGNAAVFKANIADPDSAQVKLEVELKPIDTPFDGTNATTSTLQAPGTVTLDYAELIPKDKHYEAGGNVSSFHWRARAVDGEGNTSDWVEFSPDPSPDFTAKVVPLYTQKQSEFPERPAAEEWEQDPYAHAAVKSYRCGTTIRDCGCAITSLVMLGHYYGIKDSIIDGPITPRTINNWLNENAGYSKNLSVIDDPVKYENLNGGVVWDFGTAFLGGIPGPRPLTYFAMDYGVKQGDQRITNALTEHRPAIAFNEAAGHYFIIDSTLNDGTHSTLSVRDPFWFETRTLTEATPVDGRVRKYNNVFKNANLFAKLDTTKKVEGAYISLASPAELIVTNPEGKRIGYDPRTNTHYSEIPDAAYYEEGQIVTSETDTAPHFNKVVRLPTLAVGKYDVLVVGTGSGPYTLSTRVIAEDGSIRNESITSTTAPNVATVYTLTYATTSTDIDLLPAPQEILKTLRTKIQESTIQKKTKIALLALVTTTTELVNRKKYKLARVSIEGMVALVKKERGKSIPIQLADELLMLLSDLKKSLPA